MRWPHKCLVLLVWMLAALSVVSVGAQAGPPKKAAASSAAIPDYGGRDTVGSAMAGSSASTDPAAGSEAAPNPLAQAWRACEALALVLAIIVAAVYALKRFGIVKNGDTRLHWARGLSRPSSATNPVTLVSSQPLPGGGMLHIVSVAGRNLLLAATPQSVTLISELPAETPVEAAAFDSYLDRAGIAAPAENPVAAATDRLKSLLSRSQENGTR